MDEEFITIARVVKTQGRFGEVAAELFTDFPERFAARKRLFALAPDGSRRELRLEGSWSHKERLILKFAAVDSMSDAETLIGCEIQIPRHERAELEPGASYVGDLVGCIVRVREDGAERALGPVEDVQFGAGEAPLLVVREGRREFLIPFAEAYIRRVDTQGRTILMELPEGMLELDAPLSQEEKDAQKRHE